MRDSALAEPRNTALKRVAQLNAKFGAVDACVADLLCDDHHPEKVAYTVVAADLTREIVTYGELGRESEKLAMALSKLGIGPGDRVGTLMGKSREYLITLLGIWRLGAVHVPLFTAFAPSAIALRLSGSGAKAIFCDAAQRHKLAPGDDMPSDPPWRIISLGSADESAVSFADLVSGGDVNFPAAAVGGGAPLIHIYTSGTTGYPKGVVVPVRALASFQAYAEFALDLRPDDVFWCSADPGWAYGLYFGILATLTTGTPSVLLAAGFSAETTMAVLEREGVTNFSAAPTVYRSLRNARVKPSRPLVLRCASSAGEPLTPEVNTWAIDELGVPVHDHYGQTEAGMLINNHHHPELRRTILPGSMGQAMPGWQATILDSELDAEVGTNTPGRVAMVMADSPLAWFQGYLDDPAKTAERFAGGGRWYLTGDTGLIDENGYFHFSARDDDVIIMAGYRIGPFEVEAAMATHPAVAESAVIAVPDEVRGEVMEAYVVTAECHISSPELARDIQGWVKARYAAHAYPRTIHFVDSLPKTPSGKIQRFVLKQRRIAEIAAALTRPEQE